MKYHREDMEELIIDYVDGRLSGDLKAFVEAKIEKDASVRSMYQDYQELHRMMYVSPDETPDARLTHDFQQLLKEAKKEKENKLTPVRKLFASHGWQIAASVLLVALGVMIGRSWQEVPVPNQKLTAVKQDLEETKTLLNQVLQGNLTPSQRLRTVQTSYQLETADREILDVLVRTMNTDENANVRIAAIRGLAGFTDDQEVRSALIQSLPTQEDPFIQIMLINLLVRIQEKEALPQFEQLVESEAIDPTVRDEAQLAIFKLS